MLTVEDCLSDLQKISDKGPNSLYAIRNTWDLRFISDVGNRVAEGHSISTSQSIVVIKMISQYRDALVAHGAKGEDIAALLAHPRFRQPLYQSPNLPREVRWAGDNKLIFRTKFNALLNEDLKKLNGINYFESRYFPAFIQEYKIWIVDVNSGNWSAVMDFIQKYGFGFDDAVAQYFTHVSQSSGQRSEVNLVSGSLEVSVRDDDFLDSWITGIQRLEV